MARCSLSALRWLFLLCCSSLRPCSGPSRTFPLCSSISKQVASLPWFSFLSFLGSFRLEVATGPLCLHAGAPTARFLFSASTAVKQCLCYITLKIVAGRHAWLPVLMKHVYILTCMAPTSGPESARSQRIRTEMQKDSVGKSRNYYPGQKSSRCSESSWGSLLGNRYVWLGKCAEQCSPWPSAACREGR